MSRLAAVSTCRTLRSDRSGHTGIASQVFDDRDANGVKAGSEPGLGGITITLDRGADGTIDATTSTAPDGTYTFVGLTAGTYRVRQLLPDGRTQTTANPADITLASGASVLGVDFGSVARGTISGEAFDDLDGNGVKGSGNPASPA